MIAIKNAYSPNYTPNIWLDYMTTLQIYDYTPNIWLDSKYMKQKLTESKEGKEKCNNYTWRFQYLIFSNW